jgi:hypothetical protein
LKSMAKPLVEMLMKALSMMSKLVLNPMAITRPKSWKLWAWLVEHQSLPCQFQGKPKCRCTNIRASVAGPPKLYGPHVLIIVLKTSNHIHVYHRT